ncbi:MAG: T9SS type A sorting domain-containing protein [Salibacteraceae bacterium]|nr:T9SS type A sorting domain-containing protein [Salibacteraceae bacterium]MDP4934081.1 T9SS type A sorting domain-containing protein [Salibacteraceae bacterium]MDP4965978.1 T9SS type A sorting domain-containing protein [Salibacteraceae bacterium]
MRKTLLSAIALFTAISSFAQITITQADFGTAGDSIVIGTDVAPPANLNVGGTGNQTWDFTSLSVSNINTLKFENPANTASGNIFPNSDIATERQQDTIFYDLNGNEFSIDGVTGDPFNLGVNLAVNFTPNVKQVEFPSTLNSSFTVTAYFDTVMSCAALGLGGSCDSVNIKRKVNITSNFDAYGTVETPGGTYTCLRQYLLEQNTDTVWAKFPFIGWQMFLDSASTVHNYRWYANAEQWPVLSAIADAQNGNLTFAEFKVDDNLISYSVNEQNPYCNGDCSGSATVSGLGGVHPYAYQWPASTNGGTNANASNLCAGTYDVTVYDANGDSTIQVVELENPAALSVSASVQGVSMGNDGAIDLNVSGGSGTKTFSWSGPNGFTATTEDLENITNGTYTVIVTDGNGCDTSVSISVELTGINNLENLSFSMYPNPTDGAVTIATKTNINSVRVLDVLGNLVNENSFKNRTKVDLNLTNLNSGLYLIEVTTEDGIHLKKLTIH